ncbi:MAG: C10 family peptidase, partial [Bacteroidales bacterium]|nr:C10 family peptidase [Bacteroidales bacterium]
EKMGEASPLLRDDITLQPNTPGHYELVARTQRTEVVDSVSSMIETLWDQSVPFNNYCPFLPDSKIHAAAGCVAIAAAQMLYYLHYNIGVPEKAPSEAYCYGNINAPNKDYNWDQTNFTSTIWDEMGKDWIDSNAINAAPLIAHIGKLVGIDYNIQSGGKSAELKSKVFAEYGVSCIYEKYNEEKVKNSLLNEMPVILSAFTKDPENPSKEVGHTFITDRYKRFRTVTTDHYQWVYDVSDDTLIEPVPDKQEISYSSPYIGMIGMNWGEGLEFENEWFCLTGDWIPELYPNINYNINRNMIYGFCPKN